MASFNKIDKYFEFVASTFDTAKKVTRMLARETFDYGEMDTAKFDASNGAKAAYAPHLFVKGAATSALTVSVTVMHEFSACVTFADGHKETMRRGFQMGEFIIDEYARNLMGNRARIYRTVSIVANGKKVILETSTETYDNTTVVPTYAPTARRVNLAVTQKGDFKPVRMSEEECVSRFAQSLLACYLHVAHEHGTDGTHFHLYPHVRNSATEEKAVVHNATHRKNSMSGAQRRKLRKLRKSAKQ